VFLDSGFAVIVLTNDQDADPDAVVLNIMSAVCNSPRLRGSPEIARFERSKPVVRYFNRSQTDSCVTIAPPRNCGMLAALAVYNRYLAHVIAQLPASKLETVCRIGSGDPVTLGFLATDYVVHLGHHLSQLGAADASGC
jgi:hypothetical protein